MSVSANKQMYHMTDRTIRLLCLTVLMAMAACSEKADPVAPGQMEVAVLEVQARDIPISFDFIGKTRSSRRVEIRSRVDGFLEELSYREGSMVQAGDLLFKMDRKPFEAQLSAANAELALQQARLTNARANLRRVKPLAEQNAVAQKELDDALSLYRSAAASVESAQAKVVQSELDLGYTDILSPVTGVSSYATKREGSYLGIGDNLLTYVAQIQPMWIEFSVSENQTFQLREQKRRGLLKTPEGGDFIVKIILADGSLYPEVGKITFSDASISEETGTFLMRAEIANPDETLRPGQFVKARLTGAERPNGILLPQQTVQQGSQGSFVWLVDGDSKAKMQPVEVGRWMAGGWLINQGLQGGDRVIMNELLKMRPGMPLKTVPYQPESDTFPGDAADQSDDVPEKDDAFEKDDIAEKDDTAEKTDTADSDAATGIAE
jgi:membrane fusion protein (multidrug efflux system)